MILQFKQSKNKNSQTLCIKTQVEKKIKKILKKKKYA